ncbi:Chymotrypsin-like elastase member 2A [Sparganum proliferum]
MWLVVGIFVTSFFWITVLGQDEVLKNGLPVSCGVPAGPQPPADKHGPLKTESKNTVGPGTLEFIILHSEHIHFVEERSSRPRAHNFKERDGTGYNVRVKHVVIHPEFPVDWSKKGIDIALLKLDRDVKRSRHVAFACVPQKEEKFSNGHTCYVAGWGLIPNPPREPSQDQPEKLMEKPATITDMSDCNHVFKSAIRKVHICTKQGPVSSCVGDSGGGLHCKANDGRWTVYGVASFASPRCVGEYYVASSTGHVFESIKNTVLVAN